MKYLKFSYELNFFKFFKIKNIFYIYFNKLTCNSDAKCNKYWVHKVSLTNFFLNYIYFYNFKYVILNIPLTRKAVHKVFVCFEEILIHLVRIKNKLINTLLGLLFNLRKLFFISNTLCYRLSVIIWITYRRWCMCWNKFYLGVVSFSIL